MFVCTHTQEMIFKVSVEPYVGHETGQAYLNEALILFFHQAFKNTKLLSKISLHFV